MGFRDLKVGDPVFRLLDPIKVEMLVVAVDEHCIYCDSQDQVMYQEDLPLESHWKFDRDIGEENPPVVAVMTAPPRMERTRIVFPSGPS